MSSFTLRNYYLIYSMELFRGAFAGTSITPPPTESISLYTVPLFSGPMLLDCSLLRKKFKRMSTLQNEIFPHDSRVPPAGIQQGFEAIGFVWRCQNGNSLYASILDIIFTNHNSRLYTGYFQRFTTIPEFMP